MIKKLISNFSVLILVLTLFYSTGCSSGDAEALMTDPSDLSKQGNEVISIKFLTDEEKDALIFMREEEKMARDVYITFYNTYNLKVFDNISRSEQRHMDAIKVLLDRYELDDPVSEDVIGLFNNQELQELYNTLIEQGSTSLASALEVGGIIEEVDIIDLQVYLDGTCESWDVIKVFSNLERGSENHLRAFVRVLSRQGITYEPHYLDQETFDDILNP